MIKRKTTHIRISKEYLRYLKKEAKEKDKTLSMLIDEIVLEHLVGESITKQSKNERN